MFAKCLDKGSPILALATVAAIAVTGCGGPYDAKVSGSVKLDGVAVPRGTVTFSPVDGGPAAYARIEESGAYAIRTGREAGLPSGEYQVTVTANEPPSAEQSASGQPPPPGKPITPLWYRSKQTSGLRFRVDSGANQIDLDLSSTPPPGWRSHGSRPVPAERKSLR